MKYIINILIFSFLVAITSCQKNTDEGLNNPFSVTQLLISDTPSIDASLNIVSSNYENDETITQLDITGYFNKSKRGVSDIEKLVVGDTEIAEQSQGNGFYYKHYSGRDNSVQKKPIGEIVPFTIQSEFMGSFDANIYSPTPMIAEISDLVDGYASRSKGLEINWKQDTKGTKVAVIVTYEGNAYHNKDRGLPKEFISLYKVANDLDGKVYFTADELSKIPIGGRIRFFAGRATQKIINTQKNKKVVVTCLAHCFSDDYGLQ